MNEAAYISPSLEILKEIIECEVLSTSPSPGQLEGVTYEDWNFLLEEN